MNLTVRRKRKFGETFSSPCANYVQFLFETLHQKSTVFLLRLIVRNVDLHAILYAFANQFMCSAEESVVHCNTIPSCCLFFWVRAIFKCKARLMCFIIRTYSIQTGYVQCAVHVDTQMHYVCISSWYVM